MECRKGCAACCIVVSISSALPGMPTGKPAGVRCANLDDLNSCKIHGTKEYPKICGDFKPEREMCGQTNQESFAYLEKLEKLTSNHF